MRRLADRALGLTTAMVLVFLWTPIVVLIAFSFNSARLMSTWEGATLHWYRVLAADEALLKSFGLSIYVASLTTLICILLGTPAALVLARHRFGAKAFYEALVGLPIVIPEIVMASALVIFFGLTGIRLSLTTVVLAHVAFSISFIIITVRATLAGFDPSLEEAAMDLGADEWTTFRRVTLPLILPGIVSGALLVFTISLDDYVITSFVAGVGATTLPLSIYSMVKTGITPEINAISTILLCLTIAMIALSQTLRARATRPGPTEGAAPAREPAG